MPYITTTARPAVLLRDRDLPRKSDGGLRPLHGAPNSARSQASGLRMRTSRATTHDRRGPPRRPHGCHRTGQGESRR